MVALLALLLGSTAEGTDNPCLGNGNACDSRWYGRWSCASEMAVAGSVAVSVREACAVTDGAEATCWGASGSSTPAGLHLRSIDISPDGSWACGVDDADSSAKCWAPTDATPAAVNYGMPALAVAAADGGATCVLFVNGTVQCDGMTDPPSGDTSVFSSLAAGGDFACGVRCNGNVECWGGANADSQLDVTSVNNDDAPFVAVTAGTAHACALTAYDGFLVCWGRSTEGQTTVPAAGLLAAGMWIHAAAGNASTCGVRGNGKVECWGELSDSPSDSLLFESVAVGSTAACGLLLDGAEVSCWGTGAGSAAPSDTVSVAALNKDGVGDVIVRNSASACRTSDLECNDLGKAVNKFTVPWLTILVASNHATDPSTISAPYTTVRRRDASSPTLTCPRDVLQSGATIACLGIDAHGATVEQLDFVADRAGASSAPAIAATTAATGLSVSELSFDSFEDATASAVVDLTLAAGEEISLATLSWSNCANNLAALRVDGGSLLSLTDASWGASTSMTALRVSNTDSVVLSSCVWNSQVDGHAVLGSGITEVVIDDPTVTTATPPTSSDGVLDFGALSSLNITGGTISGITQGAAVKLDGSGDVFLHSTDFTLSDDSTVAVDVNSDGNGLVWAHDLGLTLHSVASGLVVSATREVSVARLGLSALPVGERTAGTQGSVLSISNTAVATIEGSTFQNFAGETAVAIVDCPSVTLRESDFNGFAEDSVGLSVSSSASANVALTDVEFIAFGDTSRSLVLSDITTVVGTGVVLTSVRAPSFVASGSTTVLLSAVEVTSSAGSASSAVLDISASSSMQLSHSSFDDVTDAWCVRVTGGPASLVNVTFSELKQDAGAVEATAQLTLLRSKIQTAATGYVVDVSGTASLLHVVDSSVSSVSVGEGQAVFRASQCPLHVNNTDITIGDGSTGTVLHVTESDEAILSAATVSASTVSVLLTDQVSEVTIENSHISGGATPVVQIEEASAVVLSNLTLLGSAQRAGTSGATAAVFAVSGGLAASGVLAVDDCSVTDALAGVARAFSITNVEFAQLSGCVFSGFPDGQAIVMSGGASLDLAETLIRDMNGPAVSALSVDRVTWRNVNASRCASGSASGGALLAVDCAVVEVYDSNVTEASSTSGAGGAVRVDTATSVLIQSTELSSNSAGGNGGAASMLGVSTVTLNGIVAANNDAALDGGAVHVDGADALVLRDCSLVGNSASSGGGLASVRTTSVQLLGGSNSVSWIGNTATTGNGGAVRVRDASTAALVQLYVSNLEFSANTAAAGQNLAPTGLTGTTGFGGAIAAANANVTVLHSRFSGNAAALRGGAVMVDSSYLKCVNCTVERNTAVWGGGLSVDGCLSGSRAIVVSESLVEFNTAGDTASASGGGGALFVTSCDEVAVEASELRLNVAVDGSEGGGGVMLVGHAGLVATSVQIRSNSAPSGAGLLCHDCDDVTLTDCTIRNNSASSGSGGGVYLHDSVTGGEVTVSGGEICENLASDAGGGVACTELCPMRLSGVNICSNTARIGGGVAALLGTSAAVDEPIFLNDVELTSNSADWGGGLWIQNVVPSITGASTSITGNTATYAGGFAFITDTEAAVALPSCGTSGIVDDNSALAFGSGCATRPVGIRIADDGSGRTLLDGVASNAAVLEAEVVDAFGSVTTTVGSVQSAEVPDGLADVGELACDAQASGDGQSVPLLLRSTYTVAGGEVAVSPFGVIVGSSRDLSEVNVTLTCGDLAPLSVAVALDEVSVSWDESGASSVVLPSSAGEPAYFERRAEIRNPDGSLFTDESLPCDVDAVGGGCSLLGVTSANSVDGVATFSSLGLFAALAATCELAVSCRWVTGATIGPATTEITLGEVDVAWITAGAEEAVWPASTSTQDALSFDRLLQVTAGGSIVDKLLNCEVRSASASCSVLSGARAQTNSSGVAVFTISVLALFGQTCGLDGYCTYIQGEQVGPARLDVAVQSATVSWEAVGDEILLPSTPTHVGELGVSRTLVLRDSNGDPVDVADVNCTATSASEDCVLVGVSSARTSTGSAVFSPLGVRAPFSTVCTVVASCAWVSGETVGPASLQLQVGSLSLQWSGGTTEDVLPSSSATAAALSFGRSLEVRDSDGQRYPQLSLPCSVVAVAGDCSLLAGSRNVSVAGVASFNSLALLAPFGETCQLEATCVWISGATVGPDRLSVSVDSMRVEWIDTDRSVLPATVATLQRFNTSRRIQLLRDSDSSPVGTVSAQCRIRSGTTACIMIGETSASTDGSGVAVFNGFGVQADFGTMCAVTAQCTWVTGSSTPPAPSSVSVATATVHWTGPEPGGVPSTASEPIPLDPPPVVVVVPVPSANVSLAPYPDGSLQGVRCSIKVEPGDDDARNAQLQGSTFAAAGVTEARSDANGRVTWDELGIVAPIGASVALSTQCFFLTGEQFDGGEPLVFQLAAVGVAWQVRPPAVALPSPATGDDLLTFVPVPVVVINNGTHVIDDDATRCTVSVNASTATAALRGTPSVGMVNGRAEFDDLALSAEPGSVISLKCVCIHGSGTQVTPVLHHEITMETVDVDWNAPPPDIAWRDTQLADTAITVDVVPSGPGLLDPRFGSGAVRCRMSATSAASGTDVTILGVTSGTISSARVATFPASPPLRLLPDVPGNVVLSVSCDLYDTYPLAPVSHVTLVDTIHVQWAASLPVAPLPKSLLVPELTVVVTGTAGTLISDMAGGLMKETRCHMTAQLPSGAPVAVAGVADVAVRELGTAVFPTATLDAPLGASVVVVAECLRQSGFVGLEEHNDTAVLSMQAARAEWQVPPPNSTFKGSELLGTNRSKVQVQIVDADGAPLLSTPSGECQISAQGMPDAVVPTTDSGSTVAPLVNGVATFSVKIMQGSGTVVLLVACSIGGRAVEGTDWSLTLEQLELAFVGDVPDSVLPSAAATPIFIKPAPRVALAVGPGKVAQPGDGKDMECKATLTADADESLRLLGSVVVDATTPNVNGSYVAAFDKLIVVGPFDTHVTIALACSRAQGEAVAPVYLTLYLKKPVLSLSAVQQKAQTSCDTGVGFSVDPGSPLPVELEMLDAQTGALLVEDSFTFCSARIRVLNIEPNGSIPELRNAGATSRSGVIGFSGIIIQSMVDERFEIQLDCSLGDAAVYDVDGVNIRFNVTVCGCAVGQQDHRPDPNNRPKLWQCQDCASVGEYSLGGTSKCTDCPKRGVTCIAGNLTWEPGFYFADALPITSQSKFYQCFNPESCWTNVSAGRTYCAPEYEGPICGVCVNTEEKHYERQGNTCLKCWPDWAATAATATMGTVAVAGIMWMSALKRRKGSANPRKIVLRIILNYAQMTVSLGRFTAKGTATFQQTMSAAGAIGGGVLSLPPVACALNLGYYPKFYATMGLPFIVAGFAVLVSTTSLAITHLRQKNTQKHYAFSTKFLLYLKSRQYLQPVIYVFAFAHVLLVTSALSVLSCTNEKIKIADHLNDGVDEEYYLVDDYRVKCYTGVHIFAMIVAIGLGGLYAFGIPYFGARFLFGHEKQLRDADFLSNFGFLFLGFSIERRLFWWESLVQIRKLSILGMSLLPDAVLQSLCAMIVVFVSTTLHISYKPFDDPTFNRLELIALCTVFFTHALSLVWDQVSNGNVALAAADEEGLVVSQVPAAADIIFTALLLLINAATAIVLLYNLVKVASRYRKLKKSMKKARKALATSPQGAAYASSRAMLEYRGRQSPTGLRGRVSGLFTGSKRRPTNGAPPDGTEMVKIDPSQVVDETPRVAPGGWRRYNRRYSDDGSDAPPRFSRIQSMTMPRSPPPAESERKEAATAEADDAGEFGMVNPLAGPADSAAGESREAFSAMAEKLGRAQSMPARVSPDAESSDSEPDAFDAAGAFNHTNPLRARSKFYMPPQRGANVDAVVGALKPPGPPPQHALRRGERSRSALRRATFAAGYGRAAATATAVPPPPMAPPGLQSAAARALKQFGASPKAAKPPAAGARGSARGSEKQSRPRRGRPRRVALRRSADTTDEDAKL